MKQIIEFLELNGFKEINGEYFNSKCVVAIHEGYYEVKYKDILGVASWYSKDLIIYKLIGYLTYYGLMDKNFKTK